MADEGLTLNSGSGGSDLAVDSDGGSKKHQYVKIEFGASGTQTPVTAAAPLPVDGSGVTQPVSGTITADAGTNLNTSALALDANWVADDGALGKGILIQGDDGTDRKNINVDATTGDVQVDVTNTVTVNLSATDNAVLDTIDAVLDTINAKLVTGTVIGDVNLGATDNAVLDSINTSVQLIDDTVVAQGTALGSVKNTMVGGSVTTSAPTYTTGQISPLSLDTSGALRVTGSSGSTQYTLGTATYAEATTVGTVMGAVRNDTLATLADTDNELAPLQVNASGALYVDVESGAVAGVADDAAFTPGTTEGVPFFAMADETTPDSVDEGDAGIVRMSLNRNLYTAIRDAAGNERGANVNASNALLVQEQAAMDVSAATVTVDNAGTFAVQISDTSFAVADGNALGEGVLVQGDDGTDRKNINVDATTGDVQVDVTNTVTVGSHDVTNAGTFVVQEDGALLTAAQLIDDAVFADDAAFTLTSSKVMAAGAIRDDSLSTLTAVEGDVVPLRVGSTGALHVTGAGGGTQYNIDDAGGATDTGTLALAIRDDTLSTLTPVDGDYVGLRVSSTGALHVTGGGGGTEYTEDVATANPIVGTATMMERDDALATVTPIEGDWIGLRGSAEGALWVQDFNSDAILSDTTAILADTANIDTNLGTVAGIVHVDDAAFTLGTSSGVMMMGFAGTQSVNANDAGAIAMETDGAVHIHDGGNNISVDWAGTVPPIGAGTEAAALRVTLATDSTGVVSVDDNGGALTVDVASGGIASGAIASGAVASGAFASGAVASGAFASGALASGSIAAGAVAAGATSFVKLEDAASANADAGVPAMARRTATPANTSGADLDYEMLQMSAGRLWTSSTITAVTPGTAAGNLGKAEDAAHTTGDTGVMGLAVSAATPTARAGTAGDYQPFSVSSVNGALFTQTTTAAAGGATFYLNQDTNAVAAVKTSAGTLYSICCFNTHTAAVYLNLYNVASGSVTLGTTTPNMQFVVPTQNATAYGGGFVINFGPQGVAFGTAITVACATTFGGSGDPGTNLVITNITYA